MAQLNLEQDELALLRRILDEYNRDLRVEITSTETPSFKDELKEQQATLESLMQRIELALV